MIPIRQCVHLRGYGPADMRDGFDDRSMLAQLQQKQQSRFWCQQFELRGGRCDKPEERPVRTGLHGNRTRVFMM
jgi:hypothetical protein